MNNNAPSLLGSSLAGLLQAELLYSFAGPSRGVVVVWVAARYLLDCCEPSHRLMLLDHPDRLWMMHVSTHSSMTVKSSCVVVQVAVVVVQ